MGEAMRPAVGILLFPGVEVLDFAGPYEVFAAARDEGGQPYFRTVTLAEQPEVLCHGGLRVVAQETFATCPPLDLLVVPGGPGARQWDGQDSLIRFVREQAGKVKTVASVCTGAFILARAGLLQGRKATTHRSRFEQFRAEFPDIAVVEAKLVDEGDVITAGGVSSGIDLALYLLEQRFGREARRREALRLEGPWE